MINNIPVNSVSTGDWLVVKVKVKVDEVRFVVGTGNW